MSHLICDSQGVVLKAGQRVAYNMSGQVVPGILQAVGDIITVQYDGRHIERRHWQTNKLLGYQPQYGHVSRVRNGTSLLVLDDG